MYQVKFFKGCLPQILLGPLLNTLSHIENYVAIASQNGQSLILNFQKISEFAFFFQLHVVLCLESAIYLNLNL